MRITNVIWLEQFVEKIERKHHVTRDEVESLFATQPSVRLIQRGHVKSEDLYRAIGRQTMDVISRSFSCIRNAGGRW